MASHRKAGVRPSKYRHFLAGTLRCGRCGYHLVYNVVTTKGRRYDYFTCARRLNGRRCDLPNLRAEQVEAVVEGRWQAEQLTVEELERLRVDAEAEISAAEKEYATEVKHLSQRIAAVRAERLKWAEAAVDGTAPVDVVKDKQQVLGVQLSSLESQRESLAGAGGRHRANLDLILRLHTDVVGMYRGGSPLLRRAMNQTWFETLTIDEDDRQIALGQVAYTEEVGALRGLVRAEGEAVGDGESVVDLGTQAQGGASVDLEPEAETGGETKSDAVGEAEVRDAAFASNVVDAATVEGVAAEEIVGLPMAAVAAPALENLGGAAPRTRAAKVATGGVASAAETDHATLMPRQRRPTWSDQVGAATMMGSGTPPPADQPRDDEPARGVGLEPVRAVGVSKRRDVVGLAGFEPTTP